MKTLRSIIVSMFVGSILCPVAALAELPAPSESTIARVGAHGRDLLRVRGSFGDFVGGVDRISAAGLEGLRPKRIRDGASTPPAEPIAWSQISSIEHRGARTKRGAVIGAILLGGLGAAAGGAVGAAGGSSPSDVLGGVAVGGTVSGAVGALMGAIVGSNFKTWRTLYASPMVAENLRP